MRAYDPECVEPIAARCSAAVERIATLEGAISKFLTAELVVDMVEHMVQTRDAEIRALRRAAAQLDSDLHGKIAGLERTVEQLRMQRIDIK